MSTRGARGMIALRRTIVLVGAMTAVASAQRTRVTVLDANGDVVVGLLPEAYGTMDGEEWTPLRLMEASQIGGARIRRTPRSGLVIEWSERPPRLKALKAIRFEVPLLGSGPFVVEKDAADVRAWDERRRRFVHKNVAIHLPECGFLRFELPDYAIGEVWVTDGEYDATMPLESGKAMLAVTLGKTLQYEIRPVRRPPMPVESLYGPREVGEVRVQRLQDVESAFASFTGRLVQADGSPLGSVECEICWVGPARRTDHPHTDADGRFQTPQVEPSKNRKFQIRIPADPASGRPEDLFVHRQAPDPNMGEPEDLGELLAIPAIPDAFVSGLDDADLAEFFATMLEPQPDYLQFGRENCWFDEARYQRRTALLEMARRGERWIAFLEELEPSFTVQVLRCRARGEPDPLEIEIEGLPREGGFEFQFPRRAHLIEVLRARSLTAYRTSDSEGGDVILRNEMGAVDLWRPPHRSGPSGLSCVLPGKPRRFVHDLSSLAPGEYSLRILHTTDNPMLMGNVEDLLAEVSIASEEFQLRIRPFEVRLQRSEVEQLNQWIDAIDVTKPWLLCVQPWSESYTYDVAPALPEDHLFRFGPRAVPVLIDRLERERDKHRILWICAMLTNLTGWHPLQGPLDDNERAVPFWPTVSARWNDPTRRADPSPPMYNALRAAEIWDAARQHLSVEIVED